MGKSPVSFFIIFILLILTQVLICNHIMLFGVATPVIFIYVILRIPMSMSVKLVLLLSFLCGLLVDIFSDTPGVNALSCTIFAVLRKPVYKMYIGNDESLAEASPSVSEMGAPMYMKYLFSMVLIYCMLNIGIEYFSFVGIDRMLLIIVCSSFLTFLLLLGVDSLMVNRAPHVR